VNLNDTPFARLASHLLDLLQALEGHEIPLIIVGGFGLALRYQRVDESGERTLLIPIPSVRTTEDIDAILKLDLLFNDNKTLVLREKLQELGYSAVEKARNFQFEKSDITTSDSKNIKIDLLSRVPNQGDPPLKHSKPRVKGKHLHAYGTPEAIAVEDTPLELSIEGNNTTGELAKGLVYLPHPYALLLLKLFAFRDEQLGKKSTSGDRTPYARKHAGDLYAILAMTTEAEYATLETFKIKYHTTDIGNQATQIVREFFQDRTSVGALRVREAHPETTPANLETFLDLLKATFYSVLEG
jgi:hypothetical protein